MATVIAFVLFSCILMLLIFKRRCAVKPEHIDKHRTLGLKISYYRKLKGLTQEQLAEKINKNLAFIGAVEAPNVNRTISLDTLFDIAVALDIPPYKLLKDD